MSPANLNCQRIWRASPKPCFQDIDNEEICWILTVEEIKDIVWEINSLKASGLDRNKLHGHGHGHGHGHRGTTIFEK